MSDLEDYSLLLFDLLVGRGLTMTAAESCTGGLISKIMTDHPGSSEVFWGSFISYSNDSKKRLLNIKSSILDSYGAVSGETVRAMSLGALRLSRASCSVSVSGIAGPGGGSDLKPVGTVWICAALKGGPLKMENFLFQGNRSIVRNKTAAAALKMLYHLILEN
ncbi:MAG: CinA family protein [Spirochaetaceae bacterium]|nr:CinA family protein [Spirochaetaceae bacterium]